MERNNKMTASWSEADTNETHIFICNQPIESLQWGVAVLEILFPPVWSPVMASDHSAWDWD